MVRAAPEPRAELAVGYGKPAPEPDEALPAPYVGLTLPVGGALRYRLGLGLALGSATELGLAWEDASARGAAPSTFALEAAHRW